MKHHYNKEELVELKRKYEMQVSKEALEEIKHNIDLDKEIERLHSIIKEVREYIKKYRTMVDGYEDKDTGQMVYEHRLKLNKHQVRKLLEILDKVEENK